MGKLSERQDETAWLIEETWSGHVHYVHRDFNCERWAVECRRDDDRSKYGLRPLMRVPIVTKEVGDAMRFPTQEAAELWLAFQPRWMSRPDGQYQVREHMWPLDAARSEGQPSPGYDGGKSLGERLYEAISFEDGPGAGWRGLLSRSQARWERIAVTFTASLSGGGEVSALRATVLAMWNEYMRDEECDYTKINSLIEVAYEQAGLPHSSGAPDPSNTQAQKMGETSR